MTPGTHHRPTRELDGLSFREGCVTFVFLFVAFLAIGTGYAMAAMALGELRTGL